MNVDNLVIKNDYRVVSIDGVEYIEFTTNGKYRTNVIVDKDAWYNYLGKYSWTAIKQGNRITIKTSDNKQSRSLHRVVIENEYDELDYWGMTIDHINNNPNDNRLVNLRIYNNILNTTNVSSKYAVDDMRYIFPQKTNDKVNGYKVHFNVGGNTWYKNFSIKTTAEDALLAAKRYRDDILSRREKEIHELIRKSRNIEFERGLRDKVKFGEIDEIMSMLRKYNVLSEIKDV